MKGVAFAVVAVVFILILTLGVFIYADYSLDKEKTLDEKMNEMVKVKHNFYLTQKSLNSTYKISMIQNIFDTMKNGFGQEYWTQSSPSNQDILNYIENQFSYYLSDYDLKANLADISIKSASIEENSFKGNELKTEISSRITVSYLDTVKSKLQEFEIFTPEVYDMVEKTRCIIGAIDEYIEEEIDQCERQYDQLQTDCLSYDNPPPQCDQSYSEFMRNCVDVSESGLISHARSQCNIDNQVSISLDSFSYDSYTASITLYSENYYYHMGKNKEKFELNIKTRG